MAKDQKCPNCLTGKAQYDSLLDLWQCDHCFILWGDGVYDPTEESERLDDEPITLFGRDPLSQIERIVLYGRQVNEHN